MFRENKKEIIEFVLKLGSIFLGFVLYSYSNKGLEFMQGKFDPTASAVAASVAIYSWAEFWGNIKGREKSDVFVKTQTDIINDIKGKFNLQTYYSMESWAEAVFSSMRLARRVYNTCISTVDPVALNDYTEVIGDRWVKEMRSALNRECDWQDILSPNMLQWRSDIGRAAQNKTKYKSFIADGTMPNINFIIFENSEGKREVYFGFGLHREADGYAVFYSKERLVVELFWELFRGMRASLTERKKNPPSNVAVPSTSEK